MPGDVLDPHSLKSAFQNVRDVFHLAGMISILPGRNPLVERVNVEGTRNVLLAAKEAGIRRFVYTSSIHALRRLPYGVPIDEQAPFDPQNALSAYDRSKALASLEVLKATEERLDAVIACPTGVIGPYDYRVSEVGQIIVDCLNKRPMLYIDGAYDFVDVRDVAHGHILIWKEGRRGETYILSGERISVSRIIHTLWELTGRCFIRLRVPFSLARFAAYFTPLYYRIAHKKPRLTSYSLNTLASNSDISSAKAKAELGYQPRALVETLADTIRWFAEYRRVNASGSISSF
jgi:dihydroflavonol-4-reductase